MDQRAEQPVEHGWIDVNAEVGPWHGQSAGAPPELLARELRRHGIRLALVRHRTALASDTRTGNRALLELCSRDPALLPVAVLAPQRSDSLDEARDLAAHVAGFWLGDGARRSWTSAATTRILESVARAGRPLFVPIAQFGDASDVGARTAELGVPVILVGAHYDNATDTLAAGRRWPHLHIETSGLAHLGGVELALDSLGPERILFGSGTPVRAMQAPINAILGSAISDDAKRAILGGNATRMFGLRPEPIALPDVQRPDRIIDVHTHTGPFRVDSMDLRDDELVPELRRRTNTQIAIASSLLAITADTDAGNREIVEGCRRMPDRLGYLVADPNDLATTRDHIRRWGDAPGIVGAKVHCQWSGRFTSSHAIWDLFNVLADFGKPVKIHNDGDDWAEPLLRIARAHPRLTIIIAHGGLGTPGMEGAELTAAADNLYLEMCSSFANVATMRAVVRVVPAHKLLYGTDAPLLDPAFVLGSYQDADIPEAHQAAAYHENAARIFGLT